MAYTRKIMNRKLKFISNDSLAQHLLKKSTHDVVIYTAIQLYLESDNITWNDTLVYLVDKLMDFNALLQEQLEKHGSRLEIKTVYPKHPIIQ